MVMEKLSIFSAAFEGGLIAFAALIIIYDVILAFIHGVQIQQLEVGLVVIGIGGLVNWVLGYYLVNKGQATDSLALEASGRHVLSDSITSAGILLGLVVVYFTDFQWLDPLLAGAVGIYLAYTGYSIVRESIKGLMDEEGYRVLRKT